MKKNPLTTGDIAKYCHVTHRAVLKWVEAEKLKSYRTPGNHSRVEVKDFLVFLNEYKMPIPEELQSLEENKRILIVDDDPGMVAMIKKILQIKNYEIETAFDGFSAGKKFSEFNPHLITLDLQMPKLDGFAVCSQIRNDFNDKEVKIIIISGMFDEKGIQEKINMDVDDYLPKPFGYRSLLEKVERLLRET